MRNRAAWELTERHQSLVTRTETLIYELHSVGAAETDGRGSAQLQILCLPPMKIHYRACHGSTVQVYSGFVVCPDTHLTGIPWHVEFRLFFYKGTHKIFRWPLMASQVHSQEKKKVHEVFRGICPECEPAIVLIFPGVTLWSVCQKLIHQLSHATFNGDMQILKIKFN